jgi:dTDP-4-dehydrorhamnose 3,5-epimerase
LKIEPLKLPGSHAITLEPIGDSRGYFMRTYDRSLFADAGLQTEWIQENQSMSTVRHTIRGLHFQRSPHSETKFIRVLIGAILDVFVDLRKGSPTYGEWDSIELTDENHRAAYVPRGFGHAFCSLSDTVVVSYKVDSAYTPDAEGGLRWNDPDVGIEWPTNRPVLSEKDRISSLLADLEPIDLGSAG